MVQAWWSDKTVVTGLLTAILAFYESLRGVVGFLPAIDPGIISSIIALLAAFGVFGRATDPTKPRLGMRTR